MNETKLDYGRKIISHVPRVQVDVVLDDGTEAKLVFKARSAELSGVQIQFTQDSTYACFNNGFGIETASSGTADLSIDRSMYDMDIVLIDNPPEEVSKNEDGLVTWEQVVKDYFECLA